MFQIETVKVEFNNLIIFKVNSSVKLDAARDGMYGHNMSIVYIINCSYTDGSTGTYVKRCQLLVLPILYCHL